MNMIIRIFLILHSLPFCFDCKKKDLIALFGNLIDSKVYLLKNDLEFL